MKTFKELFAENTLAEAVEELNEASLKVGDSIERKSGVHTGPTFTGARKIERVISMGGEVIAYEVKVGTKIIRVDADSVKKYVKPKASPDNTKVYPVGTRIEMIPGKPAAFTSQRTIDKVIHSGPDVQYEVKVGPKRVRVDAKYVREWIRGRN